MRYTKLPIILVALCLGVAVTPAQQSAARGPAASAAPGHTVSADAFSGSWDYNATLSVDAATGKPEQAPRSAAQRPVTSESGAASTGGSNRSGRGGFGGNETQRAMYSLMIDERRVLIRDLLEVPNGS